MDITRTPRIDWAAYDRKVASIGRRRQFMGWAVCVGMFAAAFAAGAGLARLLRATL